MAGKGGKKREDRRRQERPNLRTLKNSEVKKNGRDRMEERGKRGIERADRETWKD